MLKPLKIDKQVLNKRVECINAAISQTKIDSIAYSTVLEKVLKNEFWTGVTDSNIDMFVGYINGDITKPHFVQIGDKHVHALMAGATGKGKTVTLHSMLNYLRYKYPPNELAIYHADFKRMEGIKYMLYGGSVHHRAITGTSLSSYVASLFKYVNNEMVYREKLYTFGGSVPPDDIPIEHCSPSQILSKLAHKVGISSIEKLEKYKKYLSDGKITMLNNEINRMNTQLEKIGMSKLPLCPTEMPRIIFMVDEFQQTFEMDDDDAVDMLKSNIKAITSKGRALGIHLFFASQNMSGTISDDILGQFDLRFILNCSTDVSTELLGNPLANALDTGQCIISEVVTDKEGTKGVVIKSPYISDNELKQCTEFCIKEAKKLNITLNKITYFDETVPEQEKTLENLLNKYGALSNTYNIVLGKYCKILKQQSPLMFDISRSKDNTLIVSSKDEQLYSALHTIIRNINSKSNSIILYFDSSKELEFDKGYITTLKDSNTYINVGDISTILSNIKDMTTIFNNKTIYVVLNKIDDIESLNTVSTYDSDEEEFIKMIVKPPANIRFIFTANKPTIKSDVLGSIRHLITGYVALDAQYDLAVNRNLSTEVNKNEYLMLYTDKAKGIAETFKAFMSNNYRSKKQSDIFVMD